MSQHKAINIGIYIYNDAEVLDFSGPFEVFSTANRLADSPNEFNVFLIAETTQAVRARGGYTVLPNCSIVEHPDIDVLIVVGGVHTAELEKNDIIAWLGKVGQNASIVASVCTGAFLLAQADLIRHQDVTTHWEDIADLKRSFPELNVLSDKRWIDTGKFVTSAGISAGIDMSLHLVSRLIHMDLAVRTARQMEFDWTQNSENDTRNQS